MDIRKHKSGKFVSTHIAIQVCKVTSGIDDLRTFLNVIRNTKKQAISKIY